MISRDIGYDPASIEWTHQTYKRTTTTIRFDEEYALIGNRLIELLNAAKRLRADAAPQSIMNAKGAIRELARALSATPTDRETAEAWGVMLVNYLRGRGDITERTRFSTFGHAGSILQELARYRQERYRVRNPFSPKRTLLPEVMPESHRTALLEAAKRAALDIEQQWRNPPEVYTPFIARARELVRDGVSLSRSSDSDPRVDLLFRQFRYATKRTNATPLFLYAYPRPDHLIPFLILLTYALAGNVDSVALLRRDALKPYAHPGYGSCLKLDLDKPRSGDDPLPYLVRDRGTLSVGWLVRTVIELTAGILHLAPERLHNYAFICGTGYDINLLMGTLRHSALKRFLQRNMLEHTVLKSLRVTRATLELQKSRDPFRVTRLLQQSSPSTTFHYLQTLEAALVDDEMIADVQKLIGLVKPRTRQPIAPNGDAIRLPSHTCTDPWHADHGTDAEGFCVNLLWPFNDRHFVLSLEPMPIALLLRDYAALEEAQSSLPPERFAREFAARKRIIETEVLPLIDEELRHKAEQIIPTLPKVPFFA